MPAEPQARSAGSGFQLNDIPFPVFIAGLSVLGILAVGLVVFLLTRRLQGIPNRAVAQAAAPRTSPSKPRESPPPRDRAETGYASAQSKQHGASPYTGRKPPENPAFQNVEISSGPLLLNLFVEDQNTAIGKRNIHALKSGYSFTIGGGKSDFLIFLVPVPPVIGEVRRDDNRCTFIPRKPKYFPDLGSSELPNCIGKTIRVISDKNYEIRFRLERYEDPLVALNRILNSVKIPDDNQRFHGA
jgi:hypothetical protein